MCLDCLEACPARPAFQVVPLRSHGKLAPYDPSRRQLLLAIGAAVPGYRPLPQRLLAKREPPFLLRPLAREKSTLT